MKKTYPRNVPSLVTETQALTLKICPQTLAIEIPRNCIGSACSGWNWAFWPQGGGPAPKDPVGRCGLVAPGATFAVAGKEIRYGVDDEEDEVEFE